MASGTPIETPSLYEFQPGQLKVLQDNIGAVQSTSKGKDRHKLIKTIRKEILGLPESQQLTLKQKEDLKDAINSWFNKRAGGKARKIKFGKTWSARMVLYEEQKERVNELKLELYEEARDEGKTPRSAFHCFQSAITQLWDELEEEAKEKYKRLAQKWNADGVSRDMKRKAAEKQAVGYIKKFAEDMYKSMGVRLFFFAAMETPAGVVEAGSLDFNDSIGGGTSYPTANPRWSTEGIDMDSWTAHARDYYNAEIGTQVTVKKVKRKRMQLKENEYGEPILPNPILVPPRQTGRTWRQAVLRGFLSRHYELASGGSRSIPWKRFLECSRECIADEHLPGEQFKNFAEPSKMRDEECRSLLTFWYERQEEGVSPNFAFKKYLGTEELFEAKPREIQLPTHHSEDELGSSPPALPKDTGRSPPPLPRDPDNLPAALFGDSQQSALELPLTNASQAETRKGRKATQMNTRGKQKGKGRQKGKGKQKAISEDSAELSNESSSSSESVVLDDLSVGSDEDPEDTIHPGWLYDPREESGWDQSRPGSDKEFIRFGPPAASSKQVQPSATLSASSKVRFGPPVASLKKRTPPAASSVRFALDADSSTIQTGPPDASSNKVGSSAASPAMSSARSGFWEEMVKSSGIQVGPPAASSKQVGPPATSSESSKIRGDPPPPSSNNVGPSAMSSASTSKTSITEAAGSSDMSGASLEFILKRLASDPLLLKAMQDLQVHSQPPSPDKSRPMPEVSDRKRGRSPSLNLLESPTKKPRELDEGSIEDKPDFELPTPSPSQSPEKAPRLTEETQEVTKADSAKKGRPRGLKPIVELKLRGIDQTTHSPNLGRRKQPLNNTPATRMVTRSKGKQTKATS